MDTNTGHTGIDNTSAKSPVLTGPAPREANGGWIDPQDETSVALIDKLREHDIPVLATDVACG